MNVLFVIFVDGLCLLGAYSSTELRISTSNAGNVDAETIPDVYKYYTKLSSYGLFKLTGTSFTFQVASCRDASVLLSTATDLVSADFYEIFLGGGGNTQIYLSRQFGPNDAVFNAAGLINCQNMTSLWMSWANGRLKIGTGQVLNQNVRMDWTDPNPAFKIMGIGIMSSWGSSGQWLINTQELVTNGGFFCGSIGNQVLTTFPTFNTESELECGVRCANTDVCTGFNYNTQAQLCKVFTGNNFLQSTYNITWKLFTKCWIIS